MIWIPNFVVGDTCSYAKKMLPDGKIKGWGELLRCREMVFIDSVGLKLEIKTFKFMGTQVCEGPNLYYGKQITNEIIGAYLGHLKGIL